jgi:hypothetical protein
MIAHAEQLGANAVIGIRYDATEILNGVTEVLCLWNGRCHRTGRPRYASLDHKGGRRRRVIRND